MVLLAEKSQHRTFFSIDISLEKVKDRPRQWSQLQMLASICESHMAKVFHNKSRENIVKLPIGRIYSDMIWTAQKELKTEIQGRK